MPAETEEANSSLPIPPPPPPAFLATVHFQFRGTSHMIKNAITVAKHRAPNDNSREKQTSNSWHKEKRQRTPNPKQTDKLARVESDLKP
jgi:hypothetical protein